MPRSASYSPPAAEPQLDRAARRARGVYYTPPELVRRIVAWTLDPLCQGAQSDLRVLDPACGAGEFLVEAYQQLAAALGPQAASRAVHGLDIDSGAVAAARARLRALDPRFATAQVAVADALAPAALSLPPFDAIIGNPPYVNIRQLAKTLSREQIAALRSQYQTARGNFDLYILFIERVLALLRPGGRCGLIVPNKWATLDYARPCRELLLKQAVLERVVDLSHERVFAAASVYPHLLLFRKASCGSDSAVATASPARRSAVADGPCGLAPAALSADGLTIGPALDVESRVATQPLDQWTPIFCGTTGYAAQQTSRRLFEATASRPAETGACDFITSGNIDRYAIRLGNVRYLGRVYVRPRLPIDVPELSASKRRLFQTPKIVVAGMSRRLEAAWDDRGLALGVQVFALGDGPADPLYLLALLNSKLLSYLFATRFAAKRLASGYLSINKGQLARLPIAISPRPQRLADLAAVRLRLGGCHSSGADASHKARIDALEDEIDRLVYRLYQLTPLEIARVEALFSAPATRAA